MAYSAKHVATERGQAEGRTAAVALLAGVALLCAMSTFVRGAVFHHGSEAVFWLMLLASVCNPLPALPMRHRSLALPCVAVSWLAIVLSLKVIGNPMVLFEWGWRTMTERFTLLQISVFGSAVLHICLTLLLNIWPVIVQNLPQLQKYKIQQDKPVPGVGAWYHCATHILASQLFVQLPLITGQYFFIKYFAIPYDYETMPGALDIAWRLALALIIDDTWVYFGHRALHDKRIYKYIHKVHHTYTSPFAPDAEYEHPIETVVLGVGFFTACTVLTNHLAFMWSWLYMRLLVTYDSHSGYDLPFNMLHMIPCYNGAREHDWHHQFFNGMYAPTFVWWDRLFSTNASFDKFECQRRTKEAAKAGAEMESRGDEWYAKHPDCWPPHIKMGAKAGIVEKDPSPVPFEHCLVIGAEGVVGARLVRMLAARGAKRIVCTAAAEGPTAEFKELMELCDSEHGAKVSYVKKDTTSQKDMTSGEGIFDGVEAVFNLAALTSKTGQSAAACQNVLDGLLAGGGSKKGNIAMVDCWAPSVWPSGSINGLMEHEILESLAKDGKPQPDLFIVSANGLKSASGNGLAACAVAPNLVYSPEDKDFLPAILLTGSNRLLGLGTNMTSFTHADNLAHGMTLAASKLWKDGPHSPAAGQVFAVTDGGAQSLWDSVNQAVMQQKKTSLYSKLHVFPILVKLAASSGASHKWLTGSAAELSPANMSALLKDRVFCTAKARHILGYSPVVSFEDGWAETCGAADKATPASNKKAD